MYENLVSEIDPQIESHLMDSELLRWTDSLARPLSVNGPRQQSVFRHDVLPPPLDKPAIRLLTLLPGGPEDDIHCRMAAVRLDQGTTYEALSYAWGCPRRSHTIYINDRSFDVTESLHKALRYLRRSDEQICLWVDAVCINQSDLVERSHQVSLMGDIFRACTRVFVWLGVPIEVVERRASVGSAQESETTSCGATSVTNPFALVHHFAQDKHIYQLPCFAPSQMAAGVPVFVETPEFLSLWEFFIAAITEPWWSRLWCVQEVMLAPDAVMVYGRWRLPWSLVETCSKNHRRHRDGCCARYASQLPQRYRMFQQDDLIERRPVSDLLHGYSLDLDRILRLFSHKSCQDPRDKVYGLLGLLDRDAYPTILPNYTKSVREVYMDATRAIIGKSPGDLKFLTGFGFGSDTTNTFQLPSWVRNLALPLDSSMAWCEKHRLDMYPLYHACGNLRNDGLRIHGEELHLCGISVGTVAKVGQVQPNHADSFEFWTVIRTWLSMAGLSWPAGREELGLARQQSFWRLMIGDVVWLSRSEWQRATGASFTAYLDQVVEFNMKHDKEVGLSNSILQAMLVGILGKTMCTTEEGRLLLSSPATRAGDTIWVLGGGRKPFVLREAVGVTGLSTGSTYTLVGDCIVDGLMDGEGVIGHPEQDISLV
ncbi:HET domain containing protein [Rhypophila sp. PSN 637]